MRYVLLFILLVSSIKIAYSQSQRTVLIEENTNTSSVACAEQNPDFNTLLNTNTDRVVQISYHTAFPTGDPMYANNPSENDARIFYNGAVNLPVAILDGQLIDNTYPGFTSSLPGEPQGFSQETLDHAMGIPASFDISLEYSLTPDGISIDATAACSEAVSGNLTFHLVVIEKQIEFDPPPGSNGETSFRHVMKKMLPDAAGTPMDNSYLPGGTFATSAYWEFENVVDPNQLAVVAFIQNDDTHAVLQAAFNDSQNFGPEIAVDARALDITGLPDAPCEASISPSVTIRNNGSDPLTSLTIDYTINGESGSQGWNGSLNFYQSQSVPLGDISFTEVDNQNNLMVTLSNPNGQTDENPDNNVVDSVIHFANVTTLNSTIEVYTDNYPAETNWSIRNSNNEPVATYAYSGTESGGGADANTMHSHTIMLDPFDCYTFTLYDDGGDGMVVSPVSPGPFGYRILNAFGEIIVDQVFDNFNFGYDTSHRFRTENTVSIDEKGLTSSLTCYPNPARDHSTVSIVLNQSEPIQLEIFNTVGQRVYQNDYGILPAGQNLKQIDLSNLNPGIYFIGLRVKNSTIFKKISIIQ